MKLQIKGINRNAPDSICEDGLMEEMINIRFKDGAFRPVPDLETIFDNLTYEDIFIHTNSGYKHYLGIRTEEDIQNLYYFRRRRELPSQIDETFVTTLNGEATFTQIGNVINISDSQGLKHAIWYDDKYVVVDSSIILPKIDLKIENRLDTDGVFQSEASVFRKYKSQELTYANYETFNQTANVDSRKEIFKSLITKGVSLFHEDGYPVWFMLACTAVELYDGSYILHSTPVLLGQANDMNTRYTELDINGVACDYKDVRAVFSATGQLMESNTIQNWNEFVEQTTGINGAAIKDEDYIPSGWFPSGIGQCGYGNPAVNGITTHVEAILYPSVISFKINTDIPEDYLPIVKSISIFVTPDVCPYDLDTVTKLHDQWEGNVTTQALDNYVFTERKYKDIIEELGNSQFYKIHEIPAEEIQTTAENDGWVIIPAGDLKDKLGDLLVTQESLIYDNFSHHKLITKLQFVYNSKLHILNNTNAFFKGWKLQDFFGFNGLGQFQALNGNLLYGEVWWLEVFIKTDQGTTIVVQQVNEPSSSLDFELARLNMLSYPDTRAYKMILYVQSDALGADTYKQEFKLTPSVSQNYAYYIDPELKPIYPTNLGSSENIEEAPAEKNTELIYQNNLRVSGVNNPFIFPVENSYQVGSGEGIAMATNTIALSTGQFGQFPLYLFCTDGIWGMFIGGADVNYASCRPVSREVCNNPRSVKAVDGGVIFSTIKGIQVIGGSEVKDLSEALRGKFIDINNTELNTKLLKDSVGNENLVTLASEITDIELLDYMNDCEVGYNYKESEIWFTNPNKTYSYIFSKGIWSKVKQSGAKFINDYPNQYLLSGANLYDITSSAGNDQDVLLITRPIKLNDSNFKHLLNVIVRGQLYTSKYLGLYVYGSYDCSKWEFIGGCELKNGTYNLGTRVERSSCKLFRIVFVGNLTADSTIDYIELEGKQSILSRRMR